jgi:NADH-quinone oxidoreductase subunit M
MISNYIKKYNDLNKKEMMIFLPFIILTVIMGIYPEIFLDPMHLSVSNVIKPYL